MCVPETKQKKRIKNTVNNGIDTIISMANNKELGYYGLKNYRGNKEYESYENTENVHFMQLEVCLYMYSFFVFVFLQ